MPRRKKNDQSPARVPTGPPEGGSLTHNTDYRLSQHCDRPMANNFTPRGSEKENIVRNMQEMFAHLDPEVIYIVLSECDFKVDNAMDSLLELSVAAEDACPAPIPVSGFERTAAALLSPAHFSEPDSSKPSSQLVSSPSPVLSEELDLLLDQELETLTMQHNSTKEHHNSQRVSGGSPPSSFPPPQFSQQVLPELLQSSLESGSEQPPLLTGSLEQVSGASSPLDQLSAFKDEVTERQESVLDFKHMLTETSDRDKPVPPLDLGASGRPSAFQVYKKQNPSHTLSERAEVLTCDATVGGARSKVNVLNQEMLAHAPVSWNVGAPAFFPRIHGHQGPAFITPVASNWPSHPRRPPPWLSHGPVGHTPLRPPLTIPRSWALPAAPQLLGQCNKLRLDGRVLVLLRGAPGSGKSTLARALLEHNPGGVILSTDNYFTRHGVYQFDPNELGEAHSWNHQQAKEAFQRGANPIIIDNTNMQGWEMKPYVSQALNYNYKVLFREPDTWWKNKPRELERRNTHNVSAEKIRRMLNAYERFVTVQSIMGSQMPEKKQCLILEDKSSRPESSQTPCPDLVGVPGLTEESKKSHPQLFSSLPDVSSIGHSADKGILGDCSYKSTESLTFQPPARLLENPENTEGHDDINLGDLDSVLDGQLDLNQLSGDQRIPDCIVESVMNEEHCQDDMPVAFSESIGQRVKRERTSRRSGFDRLEPADLVKDTHQSESAIKEKENTEVDEAECVEVVRDRGEVLDFVGDWPSEGSLEQRQVKRRERLKEEKGKEDGGEPGEANENNTQKVQSKHDVTEFQKLLDLIQTGVADIHTGSSLPPSLSPSSEEELEADMETGGGLEESQGSSQLNSADMSSVNSSRGELPDCVLDWKAADSCMVREPIKLRMDDWEHLKTENKTSITGENQNLIEMGQETQPLDLKSANLACPPSTTNTDSDVILETTEAEENSMGTHSIRDAVGAGLTGMENSSCTETQMEAESHTSEVCQSPEFEGFVDTGGSPLGAASANQETKQRQGRRSGKQCKLALTFTQNCPDFSVKSPECVTAPAPRINTGLDRGHTDLQTNSDPDPNPKLNPLKPYCEADLQPTVDTGCFTQTESQDFALLWRLNQKNNPNGKAATAYSHCSDITVIYGNPSRFVPEVSGAMVAIQPSGHKEVPYRVVHEKSTQVEEKELGETQNRLESLRILSRHFKLVSFDTLEDLYVKCHLDLEWTTNLLLDSGERFFRDDDGVEEEEEEEREERPDDQNISNVCGVFGKVEEKMLCFNINELQIEDQPKGGLAVVVEGTQQAISSSSELSKSSSILTFTGPASSVRDKNHSDTSALSGSKADTNTEHKETTQPDLQGGAWGASTDAGVIIEEAGVEMEDDVSSMDQIHRLLQAELEELEKEEKQRQQEQHKRRTTEQKRSQHMDIKSVELKLPTEVALQLTELFGPVGVDPGACSADDYAVQMDLKFAKLLHQQWKETIQERQKQAALSFHLLQESSAAWGKSEVAKPWPRERTQPGGTTPLDSQLPFMDHWNVSHQHISLRDIIKEEQLRQDNMERVRENRMELDKRDSSTPLKENQLYSLFPTIDRHFLLDIFRDHNYSLTQTELFLRSLLDEEPVKTVIAPEAPRTNHHRTASKEREKRHKSVEVAQAVYQDPEDPEYQDFRAEADLQRRRQLESFAKAAEAYKQGLKEVASFYAQQGHLHGQRMREANHRAAVQIFERVNASLLPNNVLDLHGLHVVEALQHLAQVLEDKTTDCEQGLCRPQLSVITGRGNHSQGGVARIRPAVIDYLTNKHYRFTEPKPGLILVSLK